MNTRVYSPVLFLFSSHRVVPASPRAAGERRGHRRPLHPILEHPHRATNAERRYGQPSVQPRMEQAHI